MQRIILSEEARINMTSVTDDSNLYKALYTASLKDADIAEYQDLIKTRLSQVQMERANCITKYISEHLSDDSLPWKLEFDSGELLIYD